jgi:hypothetical protein
VAQAETIADADLESSNDSHVGEIGLPSGPRDLGRKPTFRSRQRVKVKDERDSVTVKNRGRFKGAIRIPLRSLGLFFNNLVLPRVPRKSLKFPSLLFSIPTAPACLSFLNFLLLWKASAYTQRSFPLKQEDFSRAYEGNRYARFFIRGHVTLTNALVAIPSKPFS